MELFNIENIKSVIKPFSLMYLTDEVNPVNGLYSVHHSCAYHICKHTPRQPIYQQVVETHDQREERRKETFD